MIAKAPWAARQAHTSVVDAAGAIYVIGGESYSGTLFNDVYNSTDGGQFRRGVDAVPTRYGGFLTGFPRGTRGYCGGTRGYRGCAGSSTGFLGARACASMCACVQCACAFARELICVYLFLFGRERACLCVYACLCERMCACPCASMGLRLRACVFDVCV
jgi:hypothetical protein